MSVRGDVMMKEVVATFGRNGNLQGIACIPDQHDQDFMLVLLNAGVTHKAGPFRLNVDIARYVAANNVKTFRFDVGGLGDSEKVQSALSHEEAMMQDIEDALNILESKYGARRFVVMGLCTGAEHSHKIVLRDDRVVGCVWLDGYGYPTAKFYFYRYAPILIRPLRLLRLVSRLLYIDRIVWRYKKRNRNAVLAGNNIDDFVWRLPAKSKYIDDMSRLFNRKVKCLYVYTGGVYEYYNYADQYNDAFHEHAFMENVTVKYMPRANHTYTLRNDKSVLLESIIHWIKNI